MPSSHKSNTGPLGELVYVSRVARGVPEGAIEAMIVAARYKNHGLGITGCVIFTGQLFVQMLEGPADHVNTLFDRIRRDDRHTECRRVHIAAIHARSFASWSMRMVRDAQIARPIDSLLESRDTPADEVAKLISLVRSKSLPRPSVAELEAEAR